VVTVAGIFALLGVGSYFIVNKNSDKGKAPVAIPNANTSDISTVQAKTTPTLTDESTKEQLLYLIEEEKLAHDVYTMMYQKYRTNVFGNIIQSESMHQSRALTLL
jgi:hypothetical protein